MEEFVDKINPHNPEGLESARLRRELDNEW